jgi:hypothetical protein
VYHPLDQDVIRNLHADKVVRLEGERVEADRSGRDTERRKLKVVNVVDI